MIRWQRHLSVLYVTSALIFIRSVFRTIEYIQGFDGELMTKEFYTYIFDSALIFLAMAWMNWFHPGEIGLHLRGEPTIRNGLDLLTNKRYNGPAFKNEHIELSSSRSAMISSGNAQHER